MSSYEVTCITKKDRMSSHEHITHIGNQKVSTPWKITREEAIKLIDQGNTFYVTQNGKTSQVGVVRPEGMNPYLRTHADGYWNDNLLALPEC